MEQNCTNAAHNAGKEPPDIYNQTGQPKSQPIDAPPLHLSVTFSYLFQSLTHSVRERDVLHHWLAKTLPQNISAADKPSPGKDVIESDFVIINNDLSEVCVLAQVELLVDNEAEKDYLYDVLRMYHQ